MDVIQKLGVALGFATLAGLDLYLTVFVSSLAIYNGWIVLTPEYQQLAVLGHPAVIAVAGALYFVEFFADKVPWVDSAWDTIHTVIRPLGGAFLAVKVLGRPDPVFDIVVALLAGGVTLTAHTAKAGTRLLVNGSPEPFSNIAVSLTEDAGVFAGLGVMGYSYKHMPVLSLVVFSTFIGSLLYLMPKIFRFARIKLWLLWKKISSPAANPGDAAPLSALPADHDILFGRANALGETVAWVAPCLTGSSKGGLPTNFSGYLVATREEPLKLYFVGRRGWRSLAKALELDDAKVSHESRFLSEDLTLYSVAKATKQVFVFDRSRAPLVRTVAELIRARLAGGSPPGAASLRAEERELVPA